MASEWTDCKPHQATERMVAAKWGLDGNQFQCYLCGTAFKVGDTYRWVYMNGRSPSPGNFFTCTICDAPDLESRVREAMESPYKELAKFALLYRMAKLERTLQLMSSVKSDIDWLKETLG